MNLTPDKYLVWIQLMNKTLMKNGEFSMQNPIEVVL